MKSLTLLAVCLILSACGKYATNMKNSETQSNRITSTPTIAPLSTPDNLILSNDFAESEKALARAIREKNLPTLRKGLRSQFFQIKIKAVDALAELNDKSSVHLMVEVLQENQGIIDGGSESQIFQNDLNKQIVRALELITDSKFKVSKRLVTEDLKRFSPFSEDEMQDVLTKIREWQEAQRNEHL